MLLQKWEDRIKHAHAQDSEADQDKPALDALREVSPEEAAFMALKKWASTGRKCRQALKRANPTAVEEMELHYLQFMRQVGMIACVHTAHAHQLPRTARHARIYNLTVLTMSSQATCHAKGLLLGNSLSAFVSWPCFASFCSY